jgi:hypothetical protein
MNQVQSPDIEFQMLYEVGDRVYVSPNHSLLIDVTGLEGVVCDLIENDYHELTGYDVYFRGIGRVLSIKEHELIPA